MTRGKKKTRKRKEERQETRKDSEQWVSGRKKSRGEGEQKLSKLKWQEPERRKRR